MQTYNGFICLRWICMLIACHFQETGVLVGTGLLWQPEFSKFHHKAEPTDRFSKEWPLHLILSDIHQINLPFTLLENQTKRIPLCSSWVNYIPEHNIILLFITIRYNKHDGGSRGTWQFHSKVLLSPSLPLLTEF